MMLSSVIAVCGLNSAGILACTISALLRAPHGRSVPSGCAVWTFKMSTSPGVGPSAVVRAVDVVEDEKRRDGARPPLPRSGSTFCESSHRPHSWTNSTWRPGGGAPDGGTSLVSTVGRLVRELEPVRWPRGTDMQSSRNGTCRPSRGANTAPASGKFRPRVTGGTRLGRVAPSELSPSVDSCGSAVCRLEGPRAALEGSGGARRRPVGRRRRCVASPPAASPSALAAPPASSRPRCPRLLSTPPRPARLGGVVADVVALVVVGVLAEVLAVLLGHLAALGRLLDRQADAAALRGRGR